MSLNAVQLARRDTILSALVEALTASPDVLAIWEGGSAARQQLDDYSDIDLQIICEDDAVEHLFSLIEGTLEGVDSIDKKMRIPEPTWHGHSQCFYHLEGTPPTLLIDCAIMKRSAPDHFLAPEQHGHAVVLFDREGLVRWPEFDAEVLRTKLWHTYHQLIARQEMFQDVLVSKEIARGCAIDAVQFYHGFTLKPLLHMLGLAHRPLRHDFGRYAREELPAEVYTRLEPLYFIQDLDDLARKQAAAVEFFWEVARSIDIDALDLEGASRQARQLSQRT